MRAGFMQSRGRVSIGLGDEGGFLFQWYRCENEGVLNYGDTEAQRSQGIALFEIDDLKFQSKDD